MRGFLIGLLVGGVIVGLGMHWLGERAAPGPGGRASEILSRVEGEIVAPPPVHLEGRTVSPVLERASEEPVLVDDDVIVLRAGEGAILATGRVVRGLEIGDADVVCQDVQIGNRAALGCPHGAKAAAFSGRLPIKFLDQKEIVSRIADAPETLDQDRLYVMSEPRNQPGFGYVRDRLGDVWRVWATHVTQEPIVLDRSVHLRRERATPRAGGGEVRLPQFVAVTADPADQEYVTRLLTGLRAVPDVTQWSGAALLRSFSRLEDPPESFGLTGHTRVWLDEPFAGRIETNAHDGVRLARGLSSSGRVDLDHHSACLVEGDVEGAIDVDDHAVLIIDGSILGTVVVNFHAALRVEGDVRGTLVVKSHARVLLLGGLSGRLEVSKASHTRLAIGWPMSRLDIERMSGPGSNSFCTLYVPGSDLGDGEHEGVGGWPKVVVGRALWDSVPR